MKKIYLNLQTAIYLQNETTVVAAYNKNSNILVINKPQITAENRLELEKRYADAHVEETDLFDIVSWTHYGFKSFHQML